LNGNISADLWKSSAWSRWGGMRIVAKYLTQII
jgi:hypothetical protein